MSNPLEDPDDDWWNSPVNRRESIWLGIAGAWSLGIFTWMAGFTQFGDQNPIGTTYDVDPDRYQERVGEYKEAAEETENGLVPPSDDVRRRDEIQLGRAPRPSSKRAASTTSTSAPMTFSTGSRFGQRRI